MTSKKKIIYINKLLIFIAILFLFQTVSEAKKKSQYQKDLEKLQKITNTARSRIRKVSNSKFYDYLKLLPSVSVSQRSQSTLLPGSETYLSVSINTNQIWAVTDKAKNRAKMKRLAFRKISSLQFKIKKLINRKWLIKNQIYKFYQIRKSMSNPIKIVQIDEKIFKLRIHLDNVSIDIKNSYEEIEAVCIEVENS